MNVFTLSVRLVSNLQTITAHLAVIDWRFETSVRLVCDSKWHERLLGIRYWFTSNHIPFRFGWPREASRLEARTHEAEAKPHEAEAEAVAEADAIYPRGRGRGRCQVFWRRGRGHASRPNVPAVTWSQAGLVPLRGSLTSIEPMFIIHRRQARSASEPMRPVVLNNSRICRAEINASSARWDMHIGPYRD